MGADPALAGYMGAIQAEIETVKQDYGRLMKVAERNRWDVGEAYDIPRMKRALVETPGLSEKAKRALGSMFYDRYVMRRAADGEPLLLRNVINRATSVDWGLLDLFYRLCGFQHFRRCSMRRRWGRTRGQYATSD